MAEIKTKSPQKQTYDENLKEAQKLLRTVFPDSKSPTALGALKEYRAAAKLTDDPKASPQVVMAQTVESLRINAASSTIIKPLSTAADRIPTATPAEIAASNPPRAAATAAPQAAAPQPAPIDKVSRDMQESVREMQGLMRVTGHYKGPLNGQPDKATEEGLNKFLAERQIDPNKIPQDQLFSQVLQQLRGDVASSPRALEAMTQLKGQGADGISAVQYAMRAMGVPVPVTGTMNRHTFNGLKGLQERSAEAAANPPSAAEIRRAAPEPASGKYKFDPDVQEAQKLLVANGFAEVTLKDGDKPKQMLIDGLNGPITNKGMSDYKQKHGLGNDISFADTLTHLRNSAKPAPAPAAPATPAPSSPVDAAIPAAPAPIAATPPVEPATAAPAVATETPAATVVSGSGLKTTPFAAPPRSEPASRFNPPETDAMRNYTQQPQSAPPSFVQTMDGPSVTRALTPKHMQHIEKLAQGNGGMGGENAPADQKLIRDSLLRQAEADPNFVSKLDALSQHRVSLRVAKDSSEGIPGKPGVALGANAYEIRIDPRDLNNAAPLDMAIKGVIDGKQFNIQSLETNASIGGYALPARDKRQIHTDERDVKRLQGVLPESRVGRPVPSAPDESFETSRSPGRRIASDDYDRPQPSRTAFRASAQVDLGAVAQMIDDRNYYNSLGWDPKLAATKASEIRMSNLLGQNMDPRSADLQVKAESRSADTQQRYLNGVSRTYVRQAQADFRQDEQAVNRFARSANRLTDIFTNGNPRDNSRGFGILAEEVVRATRTTGIPGLPNGRPNSIYNTPQSGGYVGRLEVQDQFLNRPNQLTDAQFTGAARYGQHDRAGIFAQGRQEQLALASAGSPAEIIQPTINPQQQIKMFPG